MVSVDLLGAAARREGDAGREQAGADEARSADGDGPRMDKVGHVVSFLNLRKGII